MRCGYGRDGHTVIAKTCLSLIIERDVFEKGHSEVNLDPEPGALQNDGGSTLGGQLPLKSSTKEIINHIKQEEEPLLAYSIEHWFDHVKMSESLSAMHDASIDAFLTEGRCVDRWITQRARYRQSNIPVV